MSTIKDVSKEAGISVATVSHVLNNTRYVSDETKQKVYQAIKKLNYHPNMVARSLRVGKSNTIGIVLPNTKNPYFTEIAFYIEQQLSKLDYSAIICNTENSPAKEELYIDVLVNKQVDGIVFITCGDYKNSTAKINEISIPFVVVDRFFNTENRNGSFVLTDEYKGGCIAADYLHSLGHKNVGLVTGGSNNQVASERRKEGFLAQAKKYNMNIKDEWIVEGSFDVQTGYDCGKKLLSKGNRPTAIFAFNDLMALGVYKAANDLNVRIPEQLSIIGYDNIELTKYSVPAITTIGQKKYQIAEQIAKTMDSMINNSADGKISRIELEPELFIRESVSKIKNH